MITKLQLIKRYLRALFDLKSTQEEESITNEEVYEGILFKGKNLWLLGFAIIISCIGLNINSKTAIIGAMIISPLMGPVFGIGFSLAVADIEMLKISVKSVFRIIIISLFFSTLYYLLNPYSLATDELLSFSNPTIFDVVLAFVGGMAGFLAITRNNGTQVLIGVAVATSCIPPLCTAGYGFATFQWQYLLGGIYTYFINALFIGIGCYIMAKFLDFKKHSSTRVKNLHFWVYFLGSLTILPAAYLAYDFATENIFQSKAQYFIKDYFDKDYHIIHSQINSEDKTVKVDILVKNFHSDLQADVNKNLANYGLTDAKVIIYQTAEASANNKQEIEKLSQEIQKLKQLLQDKNTP